MKQIKCTKKNCLICDLLQHFVRMFYLCFIVTIWGKQCKGIFLS